MCQGSSHRGVPEPLDREVYKVGGRQQDSGLCTAASRLIVLAEHVISNPELTAQSPKFPQKTTAVFFLNWTAECWNVYTVEGI